MRIGEASQDEVGLARAAMPAAEAQPPALNRERVGHDQASWAFEGTADPPRLSRPRKRGSRASDELAALDPRFRGGDRRGGESQSQGRFMRFLSDRHFGDIGEYRI